MKEFLFLEMQINISSLVQTQDAAKLSQKLSKVLGNKAFIFTHFILSKTENKNFPRMNLFFEERVQHDFRFFIIFSFQKEIVLQKNATRQYFCREKSNRKGYTLATTETFADSSGKFQSLFMVSYFLSLSVWQIIIRC